MVRVKYRYVVAIVSVGAARRLEGGVGGTNQGIANRAAYPGCPVLFDAPTSATSSPDDAIVYRAIKKSVQAAHGTAGLGRMMARFRIVYWNPFSGLLVLRVLRGLPTEQITSAMTLITSVKDGSIERPAVLDVIHRSGTIRSCQKFVVDYYKVQLSRCVGGGHQTAIARAVARQLIDSNPPALNLDLN